MSDWISMDAKPDELFEKWFDAARKAGIFEPTAMTLATVDTEGLPDARVVLLKEYNAQEFCFFTNYESAKSQEIVNNPKGALVFHWEKPLHRQIRIRGLIEKLSYERSNSYFQTRERGSQIGAWSSPQSRAIKSRKQLEDLVQSTEERFAGGPVPCPENWGGFCLKPLQIEFWQAGLHRLHDRLQFSRENLDSPWLARRLAP